MLSDLAATAAGTARELIAWPGVLALAGAVAAGLMRGFAGFGAAMVMAPVFALLFGPAQTIAIIILMEALVTVQVLPGVWREADWPLVLWLAIPAALAMPLGSWTMQTVDAGLIVRAIGALVVGFVLILALGWRYRGPRPWPLTVGVGALSGYMMAATSVGLPPVIVYLFSGTSGATSNRANTISYIALTVAALVTVMAVQGLLGVPVLVRVALLMPVYVAAVGTGTRLFRQSSERLYRIVALAVLFCVGMTALLR